MNKIHRSLLTAMCALVTASPGYGQTPFLNRASGALGGAAETVRVFRAQSEDSGDVPLPVPRGKPAADPQPDAAASQAYESVVSGDIPDALSSHIGIPEYQDGSVASHCCCMNSVDGGLPMFEDATTWNAFSPPFTPDPFVAPPGYGVPPGAAAGGYPYGAAAPYAPYGGQAPGMPPQGLSTYGANGARPYRYGWSNAVDVSFLPGSGLTAPPGGATGDMDIFGLDYRLAHSSPFVPGWILNWTNQFSYRNWNGPTGAIGLPSDVFRFGMDFEFETPQAGPMSLSLGVNPSINTDFDASASEGFQLDARGILFFQLDPYWTLGLGAMYWDRVDDIVIPYGGLIYRDDYWEWQLMFPETRVSLFLGNEGNCSKWLYARGEYHVESWGVNRRFGAATADDEVQIEDYRILIGLKMDSGYYNWFFEGGWVLNREVTFDSTAPGFDLDTGFIGQIGLRF